MQINGQGRNNGEQMMTTTSQNDQRTGIGQLKTRVISITSGKGGVGKTTIVSNLALQLARSGKKVLLLDGDLGMANIDIMFNVRPERTIHDVVKGNASVREVMVEVAKNVALIPGGNGVFDLQNMSIFEKQTLLHEVSALGSEYDVMLIDTAPGIDDNVLYLNSAAQEICVVVTPDPSSLADSYALIKVLHQRCRENRFSIICNQVRDEADGEKLFRKLEGVASRFLYVGLDYKGSIAADPILRQATRAQQIVSKVNPDAISSKAIMGIADSLVGHQEINECKGGLQFFWEQIVGVA